MIKTISIENYKKEKEEMKEEGRCEKCGCLLVRCLTCGNVFCPNCDGMNEGGQCPDCNSTDIDEIDPFEEMSGDTIDPYEE